MKIPVALTGFTLVLALLGCNSSPDRGGAQTAKPPSGTGMLVIAYMPESADTFPAFGTDSLTVLGWLQQACDSAGIPLGIQHYSFGELVDRIGDRQNGDDGNWLYKVNGGMVPESANSHKVSPDDSVLFFFD